MDTTRSKSVKGVVTPKTLLFGVGALVALLILAFAATIFLTLRNNAAAESVLVDSIKDDLIAGSVASCDIIEQHVDLFKEINSQADVEAHWGEWTEVVHELRQFAEEIDAEYIYALKELDGEYYFVFDTDLEAERAHDNFTPYELSPVHQVAFTGIASADISNVVDEWGSFNTGAAPLYDTRGTQVGIVATDIADTFVVRHRESSRFYTTILIATTSISVALMLLILSMLVYRNSVMQRHLFQTANYDAISGLPNRNNLFSFLAREIDYLKEHQHNFAVFFIDLDNFKTVNDLFGHEAGDTLLRKIARFLNTCAEQSPYAADKVMEALTARIGGDEFLQLLPGIATVEEASQYAEGLLVAFGADPELRPFAGSYGVGLSIGAALFPSMHTNYDELIKYADIAMYHAKKHGKNNYFIYNPSMGDEVEDAKLVARVRRANR